MKDSFEGKVLFGRSSRDSIGYIGRQKRDPIVQQAIHQIRFLGSVDDGQLRKVVSSPKVGR